MYCTGCGQEIDKHAQHCTACGAEAPPRGGTESFDKLENDLRHVMPVNTPLAAIAAGYLGLLSILMFPAPFALIAGIIGIIQIKKRVNTRGVVRCIIGIVAGALGTALLAWVIIANITNP